MVDRFHRLKLLLGGILLGGAAQAGPLPPAPSAPAAAGATTREPTAHAGVTNQAVHADAVNQAVHADAANQAAQAGVTNQAAHADIAKEAARAAGEPVGDTIPPQLAGDRADAIARDMMLHPPQKLVPPQSAFRLLTASHRLGGLLDRSVRGAENTEVGRVIDVLIGDDGHPAALELDVGGFMGLGNRRIAVAWGLFDLSKPEGSDPLRVALTEAEVKSAPAVEASGQVTVVTGANVATPPKPAASGATGAPAAAANPADGSGITSLAPAPSLGPAPPPEPAGQAPPAAVPPASNPAGGSSITPPAPPPPDVPSTPKQRLRP